MILSDSDIKLILSMKDEIFELRRRLSNVVQIGEITETVDNRLYTVDVGGMRVPNCIKAEGFFGGQASSKAPLSKGDLVLLLAQGGNLTGAYIVGAISKEPGPDESDDFSVSFKDGLSIRYQRKEKSLSITVPEGGALSISSPSGIKFAGDLKLDGKLTVTGEVQGKDFETEGKVKLSKHKHLLDTSKAVTVTTEPEV